MKACNIPASLPEVCSSTRRPTPKAQVAIIAFILQIKYVCFGLVMVKVKFALEQVVKLYYFFNPGARLGWVVNATPWPLYPRERDPVPIL
jgi:hypothetical protein